MSALIPLDREPQELAALPWATPDGADIARARSELGARLRELRCVVGLTGLQLADALAWPASKVSKIEDGRQIPTDDDVRAWTAATRDEQEAENVLAVLQTLRRLHRARLGLSQPLPPDGPGSPGPSVRTREERSRGAGPA